MSSNFCSLSSGSSGNCYYVGNESNGILIDAGISATAIRKFLRDLNVPLSSIMGVLITHNHIDHIRGLEVLTRKNNLPAFTTKKIWESIYSRKIIISKDCVREIPLQQKFNIAGFDIEAFPVNHDAPETIGFHITVGAKKITIATDLGHICDNAAPYIRAANLLVLESNYDEIMLDEGRYPYFLKARIRSDRGHLANQEASAFIADMLSNNLSHICLAHLSINNNKPEQALKTLDQTLAKKGIKQDERPQISVLPRNSPSELISLT